MRDESFDSLITATAPSISQATKPLNGRELSNRKPLTYSNTDNPFLLLVLIAQANSISSINLLSLKNRTYDMGRAPLSCKLDSSSCKADILEHTTAAEILPYAMSHYFQIM